MYNNCVGMTDYIPDVPAMFVVVVLRLEHSHSFIASLDNHIPLHQDPLGVDIAGIQGMQ